MTPKPPKASRDRKLIGVWIILLVCFVAELLGHTWCRVQSVRVGYEITAARRHGQKLLSTQRQLKVELASLKSPQRIAKIARQRLGLVMPDANQTIVMP